MKAWKLLNYTLGLTSILTSSQSMGLEYQAQQLFSNDIAYSRLIHELKMGETPLIYVQKIGSRSPNSVSMVSEGGQILDPSLGNLAPESHNIFAEALKNETTTPEHKKALPLSQSLRLSHAKELLGRFYKRSVVRAAENVRNLEKHVTEWTERALPKEYKKQAKKIAKTIILESKRHGFDPVFIMAVIENESSFQPLIRGTSGEIGLMQILPDTAQWIAKKNNLPWKGEKSLKDPISNIKIGAAYLALLRNQFDSHSQLYLSAYNMGPGNVNKALEKSVWPKEYAGRVMQRYIRFYTELRDRIKKHS